jgi:hypothetical protein
VSLCPCLSVPDPCQSHHSGSLPPAVCWAPVCSPSNQSIHLLIVLFHPLSFTPTPFSPVAVPLTPPPSCFTLASTPYACACLSNLTLSDAQTHSAKHSLPEHTLPSQQAPGLTYTHTPTTPSPKAEPRRQLLSHTHALPSSGNPPYNITSLSPTFLNASLSLLA